MSTEILSKNIHLSSEGLTNVQPGTLVQQATKKQPQSGVCVCVCAHVED